LSGKQTQNKLDFERKKRKSKRKKVSGGRFHVAGGGGLSKAEVGSVKAELLIGYRRVAGAPHATLDELQTC
jgi:hypothetical protein